MTVSGERSQLYSALQQLCAVMTGSKHEGSCFSEKCRNPNHLVSLFVLVLPSFVPLFVPSNYCF